MIFPRGRLHLIGHAQLIPCVDPEHEALLISRLAENVRVRSACGMGHREHSGSSSSAVTQGSAARSNEGRR